MFDGTESHATEARIDSELQKRIERALQESGYFAMRDFSVRVVDGTAYLEGQVPSSFYRWLAKRLVASVDGLRSLRVRLRLS